MNKLNGKLCVIMPMYNEGAHIKDNLLRALAQTERLADGVQIIAVNDGSADDTLAQALLAAQIDSRITVIDSEANCGKGNALRLGTEKAEGDYIAFCDSDLELAPSQLEGFIGLMHSEHADAVIGSKMHPLSEVDYPQLRKVYSYGYYFLLRILFRLNTLDTQTGLKLFRAEVIKPIMRKLLVKRYAFDVEMLALINNRGYKIVSAPIKLVFQRGANGRIKMRDVFYTAWDTLAVFYRLKLLRYYDRVEPTQNTAGGSDAQ